MAEIKTSWNPELQAYDIDVTENGDVAMADLAIEEAIKLALFTWRAPHADYVPPVSRVIEHGFALDPERGSRLWQLKYEKSSKLGILNEAADMCREALTRLRKAGAIQNPKVVCNWIDAKRSAMIIEITITQPVTNRKVFYAYEWAWRDSSTRAASASAHPALDIDFALDRDGLD